MRKIITLLLALVVSAQAWTYIEDADWKKRIVEAGRDALQKTQKQNARNDRRGKSEENNYLIVISADAVYPNGDYLKQQAGSGRGGKTYLLDQAKLADLDNTLRAINSASEIKTYVLVIHFMPMEFSAIVPDNQSIADFFEGQKQSFVQAIAQPVMDEARTLVEAITAPELSQTNKPTLYCGFVNFRVFKNEQEGISQWIYYPRNNNINFKEEYKSMLKSSVERTEWPGGDAAKVGKLVEVIKNINEEYRKLKDVLPGLIAITGPAEMEKRLEGMGINSLSSFDVALRVHVLKVLSSADIPDTRETLIVRLIEAVQTADDANQMITAMSLKNDRVPATRILPFDNTVVPNEKKDWCLLHCITNETNDATFGVWRADNYQRLIKSLIALCKISSDFKTKVSALAGGNNDLIATRTIYYNYNSFWEKFANTVTYFPRPKLDRNTDYTADCDLKTETELFFSYLTPNNPASSEQLDPFEPIVFVNQSDLGMLSNIDDAGNTFVAPAIVLKYADDKAWNETTTDVTMAAIDAASLATGYSELKAGVKGMRKAWTLMDMANSGINLTLNATLATNNETVGKILNSYNLVTGGVAISGSLRSVYRATRGKELLKRTDITALFKNIDEAKTDALRSFSDGDLQSIRKLAEKVEVEAQARSLTEIEQQAERVVQKTSSITQPFPAWYAALPDGLKADIGPIDSDLGRLFAAASDVRRAELRAAWERMVGLFPTGSKFITDIPTLEKVSTLAAEASTFRVKVGSDWSAALDDILRNASDLKCSNCGNAGRVGRSSMDQYLDDIDHFITNFSVTTGGKGEVFYNWMRGATKNGSVPTSNQLDELHQTIRDFSKRGIRESDVRGLGQAFDLGKPGFPLKEYDLRLVNNVYTEYKNVDFASNALINQAQTIDQFINGYLRNIDSFDKFQWKAGFDKLKNAWGAEGNALNQMKKQWKVIFENNADDIFNVIWSNQSLKNSLFGTLNETQSATVFAKYIENMDDRVFKFVIID